MTPLYSTKAHSVGRFTAFILGLVAIVCIGMIGTTGYLKFKMDRAETLLAAPDAAVGSDQEIFDRLRRILGYGGFLGLAQNYALKHDASGFSEMKSDIKAADEIVSHLPDLTPAETRHDMIAIVSAFDAALQKINAPASEAEFAAADLAPLYAAMPILDARIASANAETRLGAQNQMQFWGMLLTLVSWCSLVVAAFCAACMYLTLRDKHSAPMRALAQSIENMSRGDMRTAIWGIERQDMIGDLARAVDLARYHFSHLPDLTLISEQGPVRMKFEGGSRSLFEAMMKAISRDSENVRDLARSLDDTMKHQKNSIGVLSDRVENVLTGILQHGKDGDQQIRMAISEMVNSTELLKNAHAHAADQLNRLVPQIQDRAAGMAEIAQITGKQVAQTLQSLTLSEMNLKTNADSARETLARLSSTADDLGERLFGAINLLQASGKILAETTDRLQGRMGETQPAAVAPAHAFDPDMLQPLSGRLEQIVARLDELQGKIGVQIAAPAAADSAEAVRQDAAVNDTIRLTVDLLRQSQATFEAILTQIQAKLDEVSKSVSQPAAPVVVQSDPAEAGKAGPALLSGVEQLIAERVEPKFAALERNLEPKFAAALRAAETGSGETQSKFAALGQTILTQLQKKFEEIGADIRRQAGGIIDQNTALSLTAREALIGLGEKISSLATVMPAELRNGLNADWQKLSAQMEAVQATLERNAAQQTRDIIEHNGFLSLQAREPVAELNQKLTVMAASLPGHVRDAMQPDWIKLSAQLEGAQGAFERHADLQKRDIVEHNSNLAGQAREAILLLGQKFAALSATFPVNVQQQLQEGLQKLGERIESAQTAIERNADQHKLDVVAHANTLTAQLREPVSDIAQRLSAMAASLPADLQTETQKLSQRLDAAQSSIETRIDAAQSGIESRVDGLGSVFAEKLEARFAALDRAVRDQSDALAAQTAAVSAQARDALIELAQKLNDIVHTLPPELRRAMEEDWNALSARLVSIRASFENLFAERLAPQLAAVEQAMGTHARAHMAELAEVVARIGAAEGSLQGTLAGKLAPQIEALDHAMAERMRGLATQTEEAVAQTRDGLASLADKLLTIAQTMPVDVRAPLQEQMIGLSSQLAEQVRGMAEQGNAASAQMRGAVVELASKLADLAQTLPHEVRGQVQVDISRVSAQVDAARDELNQAVAKQIAPKFAELGMGVATLQMGVDAVRDNVETTRELAKAANDELAKPQPPLVYILPPELQQQMHDHWHQLAAQIEASRGSVDRLFSEQVAGKLDRFEQALAMTRQMVDKIREDFVRPPKLAFNLPPELQQQLHDHWFQVAAQIEASRASMAETIAHEVEKLETRIQAKTSIALSRSGSDYATQRQIEQQTQILSELVATLAVLDEHMQQLKTDMHATTQRFGRTG